jgi:putative phage-type endonuclease
MQQGSEEWRLARCGHITASRLHDLIARGAKGKYLASRQDAMLAIIEERLTGVPVEVFETAAMRWGTETEPQAIALYGLMTGEDIEAVGYVPHPTIATAGASPDGLVGPVGLVEVKCPTTKTHLMYLLSRPAVPERYMTQMQWQMACAGRAWCDFVSFDPRLPPEYQMMVTRIHRHQAVIDALEAQVLEAEAEISSLMEVLK